VQLCCLADAHSRLRSINTIDITYLDNWIEEEKSVLEKSSKKLKSLNSRRASLEDLSSPHDRPDSSSQFDLAQPHRVGSQLRQLVLPSVPSTTLGTKRNSNINLSFPSMLSPIDSPLWLTRNDQDNVNEKSTGLSLLQREYDSQSSQLKYLVAREREAKRVSVPLSLHRSHC
jgi:hypothetical protein